MVSATENYDDVMFRWRKLFFSNGQDALKDLKLFVWKSYKEHNKRGFPVNDLTND